MHDHPAIFVVALLLFVFGLVSRLAEKSPVTGPMVFLTAGVLMGPLAFNVIDLQFNAPATKIIAEATLIIILFVDASMIHFTSLRKTLAGLPARLLAIGLPLTMILGTAVAWIMFRDIDIWMLIMVALILSPTDAALGQAVIKSREVPERIRESISIESGLNDGIVLPLILVCIAVLATGAQAIDGSGQWVTFMAMQLTLGPIIGGCVGLVGGRVIDWANDKEWMEATFHSLAAISIALLAYAFAELVHGNGFIAAFFAGLLLGTKSPIVRARIQSFGEAEGQMLSLSVFFILGLAGVPAAVQYMTVEMLVYAVLSLTFIRMIPVAISMIGSGWSPFTVAFVGWFGPRGIASILYLLIAVGDLGTAGFEWAISVVVIVVTLSTILHGVSAIPLTKILGTSSRDQTGGK